MAKRMTVNQFQKEAAAQRALFSEGGQGSGNFGHAGRPGQLGGSGDSGSGGTDLSKAVRWKGAKVKKGLSPESLIKRTRTDLASTLKSYRANRRSGKGYSDTADYFLKLDIDKMDQKLRARDKTWKGTGFYKKQSKTSAGL